MSEYFTVYDYLVLIALLLVSVLIGVYHGFKPILTALFKRLRKTIHKIHQKQIVEPDVNVVSNNEALELGTIKNKTTKDETASDSETPTSGNRTSDYLTANASMGSVPLAFSLLATFFSATALLGYPAEIYEYGIQWWISVFAIVVGPFLGAYGTGPLLSELKVSSMFEYLELRFQSSKVRRLGMAIYVIKSFFTSAVFMYGPATSLSILTDIDEKVAIALVGLIGTFCTAIGGIRAVIWTDLFQALVMITTMFLILVKGIVDGGGFENLWRLNEKGGRLNLFNFDPDPFIRQSFWPLVLGSMLSNLAKYGVEQETIQRFQAAKTQRIAQRALLLNIPFVFVLVTICSSVGLVLYGNFADCDPFTRPTGMKIRNPNQLVTFFVINNLNMIPGAAGLFLGTLFCASLSSLSSSLNSQASIIWTDFFKAFAYFRSFSDTKALRTNKVVVLVSGLVSTGLAFIIASIGGNLVQITVQINGSFGSPLIGLFFMSLLIQWVNKTGALCGAAIGFVMSCWLAIGTIVTKPIYSKLGVSIDSCPGNSTLFTTAFSSSNMTNTASVPATPDGIEKFNNLSYMWFATFGVLVTFTSGLLVSLATGGCRNKADDSLLLLRFRRHKRAQNKKRQEDDLSKAEATN